MTSRLSLSDLPASILADPRNVAILQAAMKGGKEEAPAAPEAKPQARREPHGPNKTEERFNREVLGGRGRFEAITFKMAGQSKYTPDFVLTEPDGHIGCYEVKGSYRLPSEGRALTAFRECRAWAEERFPGAFRFRWFRRSKDGWQELHMI